MTTKNTKVETRTFETEIQDLLKLIAHSLYSNKEIFIRELVSNASDAIDKVRFLSLTDSNLLGSDTHLQIKVTLDSKKNQFIISDNGIGMNKEELIKNIGTIARSGSKEFMKNLDPAKKGDLSFIGQFGVGFYSVFMVASKVSVISKRAGENNAFKWESNGEGSYTIEETSKDSRGTEIVLDMNDDGKEFLEDWKVRSVIRKFSDFVAYDILMPKIDTRSEEEKEKDIKEGKIVTSEYEVINSGKALWAQPKDEITDKKYEEFYTHISHDHTAPLTRVHFNQEGIANFTSILYIPSKAPYDLFTNIEPHGLHLFVKKVFIMDDCKTLLPGYLRFVKGVVDCDDLPLNVSREILQQNKIVEKIKKAITKKIINLLKEMSEKEPENYLKFWKEFGVVIKEGLYLDYENKDKLADLLRYQSSGLGKDKLVSLKEYISRMKESQKDIYYITCQNLNEGEASPHIEIFNEKGIEVLFMTEPVDEWVVSSLTEYETKKLVSITKGELDLGDLNKKEKEEAKKAEKELKNVSEIFRKFFQDKIKEVRTTSRLKSSPCCIVADVGDMGANMEKLMKLANKEAPLSKKILEINPEHPVIKNLQKIADENAKNPRLEDWVKLLYDQALLAQGEKIEDPKQFNERLNKLLIDSLKN